MLHEIVSFILAEDADDSKSRKRKRSAVKLEQKSDQTTKASYTYWLMKSEPESRIENGVDVKVNLILIKTNKDKCNSTCC